MRTSLPLVESLAPSIATEKKATREARPVARYAPHVRKLCNWPGLLHAPLTPRIWRVGLNVHCPQGSHLKCLKRTMCPRRGEAPFVAHILPLHSPNDFACCVRITNHIQAWSSQQHSVAIMSVADEGARTGDRRQAMVDREWHRLLSMKIGRERKLAGNVRAK